MGVLWAEFWWGREQSEDLGQFLLQPLMQDGIGTGGDAFDANLSGSLLEQGEQLGSPVLRVFMGLLTWFSRLFANGIQEREWSDRVPLHLASRRATPLARLRCKPAR